MKLRLLVLLAIFCLANLGFAYTWGETAMVVPAIQIVDNEIILGPGGMMDDPQPDTIFYDNNLPTTLLNGPNTIWADVKFTAPVDFTFNSVYLLPLNQNSNQTNNLTIVITSDNAGLPVSPALQVITVTAPIPPYPQWIDRNLTPPLTFTAGQNFHVMYNCPMGIYPSGIGWWPFFDNANTANRSRYASQPTSTAWTNMSGDLMIRAGGVLEGGFIDLATTSVYNTAGDFFFMPNQHVTFKSGVSNLGLSDADTYVFTWEVKNAAGTTVWTDAKILTGLASGASATLTADSTWTPTAEGVFTVTGTADHPDDADPSNDTNYLEQNIIIIDAGGTWLSYEDGGAGTSFNFGAADGVGNSFDTPDYPVKIDSIGFNINSGADVAVKIYENDGAGMSPGTELWTANSTLISGWNYFTPHIDVFSSFTVAVIPNAQISILMDETQPIAGSNTGMPVVTWSQAAGAWEDFERGDIMIRAFITESAAVPPEPVFACSDSSIDFGEVAIGYPQTVELWIYNQGGVQDLVLNTMLLYSPIAYTLQGFTAGTHIEAGDSTSVTVTFNPPAAQVYNNQLAIMHNAATIPFIIPVTGTGSLGVDNNSAKLLTFKLGQNEPNPFNPTTTIDYTVPSDSHVELVVFNTLGNEVARLVDGYATAGQHSAVFNGSALSSGVYFYRLTAGNSVEMKKMVLMK